MPGNRKPITSKELLNFIRSLPPEKLNQLVGGAEATVFRALMEASCEEFFDKIDILLPSHESSRQEAQRVLTRLCAGHPNLPPALR